MIKSVGETVLEILSTICPFITLTFCPFITLTFCPFITLTFFEEYLFRSSGVINTGSQYDRSTSFPKYYASILDTRFDDALAVKLTKSWSSFSTQMPQNVSLFR